MIKEQFKPALNRQIIYEAAEWFVEINEGEADVATRRKFHAWLSLSPEHVRAYLKILPVWEEGARLDAHANGDPQALIEWAKARSNVVAFEPATAQLSETKGRGVRRHGHSVFKYAMAASVALVVASLAAWLFATKGSYATDVGEQRLIALADGSTMELNSRSRVKVRFTGRQRSIELIAGQALFQVAKDATRPFVVRSGNTDVRAVGTQFDVYRKEEGTVVTVVEGRVAVSPVSAALQTGGGAAVNAATLLSAGEQLVVSPAAMTKPKNANMAMATAWTQQRLVFFGTSLTDVAEEFNRYNKRQLVVKSDRLRSFHISGTFSSTDPASLIRFLREQPGLQIREDETDIEVDLVSVP